MTLAGWISAHVFSSHLSTCLDGLVSRYCPSALALLGGPAIRQGKGKGEGRVDSLRSLGDKGSGRDDKGPGKDGTDGKGKGGNDGSDKGGKGNKGKSGKDWHEDEWFYLDPAHVHATGGPAASGQADSRPRVYFRVPPPVDSIYRTLWDDAYCWGYAEGYRRSTDIYRAEADMYRDQLAERRTRAEG